MATPNVNFFIHSVPCLDGLGVNDKLVKKYFNERNFYGCNQTDDFINYVNDGSHKKLDFIDYSGNNEKSSGIFDFNGHCNNARAKELRQLLRKTKSPIWHGLITFEKEFGNKFCDSYEKAYELIKAQFPKFLKDAGFDKNNIELFAGFHTNTEHKHIHFSFFEKEPTRYRKNSSNLFFSHGEVVLNSIQKIKVNTELYLTSSSEKIANIRKDMTTIFEKDLKEHIAKGEILKNIKNIMSALPLDGRISYDSENMLFLKNKINYLVDLIILKNSTTKAVYKSYLTLIAEKEEAIKAICKASKIDPNKVALYEKYHKDLYRRLGNQVINYILKIKSDMRKEILSILFGNKIDKVFTQNKFDKILFNKYFSVIFFCIIL
ncbi:MAG: relaxase MobL, partial [Clostridia bacterium]